jgi:hypothetical protein
MLRTALPKLAQLLKDLVEPAADRRLDLRELRQRRA